VWAWVWDLEEDLCLEEDDDDQGKRPMVIEWR